MSDNRITAETRTEFGKGPSRRARAAGKVPAVLYGHGSDPRHILLPSRELAAILRHGGTNAVLTLDTADGEELALPKAVVRHPVKDYFEHIDLLVIKRGEKVTVDVPVIVTGTATPGSMVLTPLTSLTIEVEAMHIPENFEVSIDGLAVGTQITAADVAVGDGVTVLTDAETLVVGISEAQEAQTESEEADEDVAAEAEADQAAEEG